MNDDLVYRLRKRAEIRRQIPSRKSVQEGEPDRIADLLEEAADALEQSKPWVKTYCGGKPNYTTQPEPEPENLEPYLERLVDLCNNTLSLCGANEVISAEAALERLYISRIKEKNT